MNNQQKSMKTTCATPDFQSTKKGSRIFFRASKAFPDQIPCSIFPVLLAYRVSVFKLSFPRIWCFEMLHFTDSCEQNWLITDLEDDEKEVLLLTGCCLQPFFHAFNHLLCWHLLIWENLHPISFLSTWQQSNNQHGYFLHTNGAYLTFLQILNWHPYHVQQLFSNYILLQLTCHSQLLRQSNMDCSLFHLTLNVHFITPPPQPPPPPTKKNQQQSTNLQTKDTIFTLCFQQYFSINVAQK